MKEQIVTFETAKLAKEKGFDLLVNEFYCIDGKGVVTKDNGDGDCEYICLNHNKYPFYHSAPDQSLLQKWLREKHNIDVEPYLITMESNGRELEQDGDCKEYTYKLKYKGISQFVGNYSVKTSYEETFEIGLQEALKLI